MATAWYWAREGQQFGPIGSQELKTQIQERKIDRTDLIWCEGMADWMPAEKVQRLAGLFPALAPEPTQAAQAAFAHVAATQPVQVQASYAHPAVAHAPSAPMQMAASTHALNYDNPHQQSGPVVLTATAMTILRGTKPWTRFIGILLFVLSGLIAVLGLFMAVLGFSVGTSGPRGAGLAGGMGALVGLIYLGMAALYFFPACFSINMPVAWRP